MGALLLPLSRQTCPSPSPSPSQSPVVHVLIDWHVTVPAALLSLHRLHLMPLGTGPVSSTSSIGTPLPTPTPTQHPAVHEATAYPEPEPDQTLRHPKTSPDARRSDKQVRSKPLPNQA